MRILRDPKRHPLAEGEWVEANGSVWESATEVLTFTGTGGTWSRIFYRTQAAEKYSTYPASQVRVITSATETPAVAEVLRYWREVVSCLPRDDPLRPRYEKLAFVHPESVLHSFLNGSPIEERSQDIAPIFPFRCNLSQRAAVEKALTRSISVIEGPPGTGKTETILNLIANIVAVQHMTVGIVSFGNAAVDNVRDKLDKLGFGHLIGNLGRREKREEFFAGQAARNTRGRAVPGPRAGPARPRAAGGSGPAPPRVAERRAPPRRPAAGTRRPPAGAAALRRPPAPGPAARPGGSSAPAPLGRPRPGLPGRERDGAGRHPPGAAAANTELLQVRVRAGA